MMKHAFEKIDVVYDSDLISGEYLIKMYENFLCDTFSEDHHNIGIVLHSGSLCFDIISVVFAAISNLILNDKNVEHVLDAISNGDIVTYKKQRYVYRGIKTESFFGTPEEFVVLEQDKNKQTEYVPRKRWNHIVPYFGNSQTTGGSGLRKTHSQRNEFIAEITGKEKSEIPGLVENSTVILMPRDRADDILRNVKIVYGERKIIKLLDLVTAAYYTEHEEYNYGGNAEKVDPILKITSKIGVARRLVKKRADNEVKGAMILGLDGTSHDKSELSELMERVSLGYIYTSYSINSELGDELAETYPDANLFACTKEFLLNNSLPVNVSNYLTNVLNLQTGIIVDKTINSHFVEGNITWEEYKAIKSKLRKIKYTESINENKETFIIQATALLNLFVTAPFTMSALEACVQDLNIISPKVRLEEIRTYAEHFMYGMKEAAMEIIASLEKLYSNLFEENEKERHLKKFLNTHRGEKTVIVVPRAYYAAVLQKTLYLYLGTKKITFATTNKFNNETLYDRIIVVGNIKGKRFNPFKCNAAIDIDVMLYDFEKQLFDYHKRSAETRELEYNVRNKILDLSELDEWTNSEIIQDDVREMDLIGDELDMFYEKLNVVAIKNFINRETTTGTQTIEVTKVSRFVEGQSALFSKHYKAIVFDEETEEVKEKNVEDLLPGDVLIFTKNDSFTKSIVDNILEHLIEQNLLSEQIKDAYMKSVYWKDILRAYIKRQQITYNELGKAFAAVGSTKHYGTIRSWIQPFSHIVGPMDLESYEHVAIVTQDTDMLSNPAAYRDACRIIRSERTKILDLIAKAIVAKLLGKAPQNDKVLSTVFDNIDNLSMRLQIDSITSLEEEYQAPMGMVNKPINI